VAFQAVGAATRHRRLVAAGHRACALVILGFTFWGLFLFVNGRFDLSDPVPRATQLLEIAAGETAVGVTVPFTWMTLRSWDNPAREERLLLRGDERWRLWGGQPVVVLVRQGFFGTPWVSAVEPDFDKQSREILALVPEAAGVWQELTLFNLRIHRFDEARRVAGEYVTRFPGDRAFPVYVARILTSRDRFPDVAALLAPVAARHEDADVYMLLGYALGMQGRRADGLRYLQRARQMQPDNWWPHYALGWVYGAHGDTANAVLSFERALQLRPGLPDVETQLPRLRSQVAGQRT
jgi:tetratricopeptide (TPR) repeat protein